MARIRHLARRSLSLLALAATITVAGAARADNALSFDGIEVPDIGLTRQIAADRLSGTAIGGYDPVAYFTDGRPLPGRHDLELVWGGVAWRFATAGNRDAFAADPAIYAPRFGGYAAEVMARGGASDPNPQLFSMQGGRLYLFRTPEGRDAFSAATVAAAAKAWPAVEASLAH